MSEAVFKREALDRIHEISEAVDEELGDRAARIACGDDDGSCLVTVEHVNEAWRRMMAEARAERKDA